MGWRDESRVTAYNIPHSAKEETPMSDQFDTSTSLREAPHAGSALLANGLNNKDISSKLRISSKTVDKHLERIYQKLEVTSRAEAVLWGIAHGGDFPY